jgi:hypothetical protein
LHIGQVAALFAQEGAQLFRQPFGHGGILI